jgi:hypothetical protein
LKIKWELSAPSENGGWIIQHIRVFSPEGELIRYFWEAWEVSANSTQTSLGVNGAPFDDHFRDYAGTKVYAEARYYDGIQLPPTFAVNQGNTATRTMTTAGILPASIVDPRLLTTDAQKVTNEVSRRWTAPDPYGTRK